MHLNLWMTEPTRAPSLQVAPHFSSERWTRVGRGAGRGAQLGAAAGEGVQLLQPEHPSGTGAAVSAALGCTTAQHCPQRCSQHACCNMTGNGIAGDHDDPPPHTHTHTHTHTPHPPSSGARTSTPAPAVDHSNERIYAGEMVETGGSARAGAVRKGASQDSCMKLAGGWLAAGWR